MGLARAIGIALLMVFVVIPLILLAIGVFLYITQHQTTPTNNNNTQASQSQCQTNVYINMSGVMKPVYQCQVEPNLWYITYQPVGINYLGPPTTAIAGYYCVSQATGSPYSIQLNAALSNGYWIQDFYSTSAPIGFVTNVWSPPGQQGSQFLGGTVEPGSAQCAWLVISIRNGIAYFGYSLDGVNVNWYYSYYVGNASIIPSTGTNILVGGPDGNQPMANLTSALIHLALYYWNGTAWVPAPVGPEGATAEYVSGAYMYYSPGSGLATISWPNATISLAPVSAPGFKP